MEGKERLAYADAKTIAALARLGTELDCTCARMLGFDLAEYLLIAVAASFEGELPLNTVAALSASSIDAVNAKTDHLVRRGLVKRVRCTTDHRARSVVKTTRTPSVARLADEALGYTLIHALGYSERAYDDLVACCESPLAALRPDDTPPQTLPLPLISAAVMAREALTRASYAEGISPIVVLALLGIDQSVGALSGSELVQRLCSSDSEAVSLLQEIEDCALAVQVEQHSGDLDLTDKGRAIVDAIEQSLPRALADIVVESEVFDEGDAAAFWSDLAALNWSF